MHLTKHQLHCTPRLVVVPTVRRRHAPCTEFDSGYGAKHPSVWKRLWIHRPVKHAQLPQYRSLIYRMADFELFSRIAQERTCGKATATTAAQLRLLRSHDCLKICDASQGRRSSLCPELFGIATACATRRTNCHTGAGVEPGRHTLRTSSCIQTSVRRQLSPSPPPNERRDACSVVSVLQPAPI